ncbi:calcium-binding protein [Bradyrhizobium sp. 27S5]|uniref:calcium-binding protein n=1 Tax=Bradyrhizobium sp. 27S5 TaxID=3139728 RepID=UPI0030CF117F
MAWTYTVQLNDAGGAGAATDSALVYDLQQALSVWQQYVGGIGNLVVDLNITTTAVGRADGGPTSSYYVGTSNGLAVYEPSSQYELTTGQHVSGTTSDITINVDTAYLQYLDLDYGLSWGSSVPYDKLNPIDVFLHEVMHGLGMTGWYSQSGQLPGAYESTFDTFIQKSGSLAYFTGSHAEAAYGGPVPLTTDSTTQNYYHFGNQQSDFTASPSTVADPLTLDLMNGIVFFDDYQYAISPLDLGVLKDLGYSVRGYADDTMNGTAGADSLYGTTLNDLISSGAGNDIIVAGAGFDTVDGGDGNDYVYAGADADVLSGGNGNDVLLGEDGDDAIYGGTGFNYLFGGSGNDTLVGAGGTSASDVNVMYGGDGADYLFGGAGTNYFYGGTGVDTMYGGSGLNIFISSGETDGNLIYGGSGQNYVYGSNGGDTVTGGTSVDVFLMGSGADNITGGGGVDYAWGGGGSDIFNLNDKASDTEVMVVEDFNAGGVNDFVNFAGTSLHSFADVQAAEFYAAGINTTIITDAAGNAVWLIGEAPGQLSAGMFKFS